MIIEINPAALDGFVRAWLEEALEGLEFSLEHGALHPDDVKQYKKDIKAMKRLLEYIGDC